jgi:hypothetical protein
MEDVVPDEQGQSRHEAEATEIQKGLADDGPKPGRVPWMDGRKEKHGGCVGRCDSTHVNAHTIDKPAMDSTGSREHMPVVMNRNYTQWRG